MTPNPHLRLVSPTKENGQLCRAAAPTASCARANI